MMLVDASCKADMRGGWMPWGSQWRVNPKRPIAESLSADAKPWSLPGALTCSSINAAHPFPTVPIKAPLCPTGMHSATRGSCNDVTHSLLGSWLAGSQHLQHWRLLEECYFTHHSQG